MSDQVLQGVRVTEVRTMAGPILYRVEVLWYPGSGWRTDRLLPTQTSARKRVGELMEGLDATDGEKVTWEWRSNEPQARQVEVE